MPIRAKHTTITGQWLKQFFTGLALVKPHAGIGRHAFLFLMVAVWAGDI
jgi:hypothetical protein